LGPTKFDPFHTAFFVEQLFFELLDFGFYLFFVAIGVFFEGVVFVGEVLDGFRVGVFSFGVLFVEVVEFFFQRINFFLFWFFR